MKTKVIALQDVSRQEGEAAYEEAGEILRQGGLVAFPTETVYGLGGNALNPEASHKIYAAKGRPSDNPLIVHIWDVSQVYELAREVSLPAEKLMAAFWPGPLTIVFPKKACVPKEITGGLDTVAIRMPDHEVALGMLKAAGVPVAAPSANTSGRPSPTRASHVYEDMRGRIEMILDGGEVGIGVESTIVDLTEGVPQILRPGYISQKMLEEVLNQEVRIDPAILQGILQGKRTGGLSEGMTPKAPGMKYRHYAPKASLSLVRGETERVKAYICEKTREAWVRGEQTGVLCTEETALAYQEEPGAYVVTIGRTGTAEEVAHNLYACLRIFDAEEAVTSIYCESFSLSGEESLLAALDNRLSKATGGMVITLEG